MTVRDCLSDGRVENKVLSFTFLDFPLFCLPQDTLALSVEEARTTVSAMSGIQLAQGFIGWSESELHA